MVLVLVSLFNNSPSLNISKSQTMNNTDIIKKFYDSFARADAEGMVSCYDANIQFTDPAFGPLKGDDAANMWRMLVAVSKGNLKITFGNMKTDDKTGSANWTAEYIFSQTGRKVINHVSAHFEFKDGKIIRHTDKFNFWKWTRQALGWKGYLLGWTSFMQKKVQENANRSLRDYVKK